MGRKMIGQTRRRMRICRCTKTVGQKTGEDTARYLLPHKDALICMFVIQSEYMHSGPIFIPYCVLCHIFPGNGFFTGFHSCDIILCHLNDLTGEKRDGNQVRQRHKSVEGIGNVNYQ